MCTCLCTLLSPLVVLDLMMVMNSFRLNSPSSKIGKKGTEREESTDSKRGFTD